MTVTHDYRDCTDLIRAWVYQKFEILHKAPRMFLRLWWITKTTLNPSTFLHSSLEYKNTYIFPGSRKHLCAKLYLHILLSRETKNWESLLPAAEFLCFVLIRRGISFRNLICTWSMRLEDKRQDYSGCMVTVVLINITSF